MERVSGSVRHLRVISEVLFESGNFKFICSHLPLF